jgi:hypothetical protein
LWTYLYFDDSFLRENYYWRLPTIRRTTGILWYGHKTPSKIYATAKAIIQLCPHSPTAPLPDFQNLSPKQKEGIYHHIEEELEPGLGNHTLTRRHDTFVYEALAHGAMPTSTQLMIYAKFYLINTWRDVVSLALNLTSGKYTKILPGKAAHLQFSIPSQQKTRSRNCTTSTLVCP